MSQKDRKEIKALLKNDLKLEMYARTLRRKNKKAKSIAKKMGLMR